MMKRFVVFKVYNDADILEKIMKDRRKDLGPATDDDDTMSPKFKISMSLSQPVLLLLNQIQANGWVCYLSRSRKTGY